MHNALIRLARWYLRSRASADCPAGVALSGPLTVGIGDRHGFYVVNPCGILHLVNGARLHDDTAMALRVAMDPAPDTTGGWCGEFVAPVGGYPWLQRPDERAA